MSIKVPWQAWYGDTEQELDFPVGWQVTLAAMADALPAGEEIVLQALRDPASVLPAILSELEAGGLYPENVWLTMGLGAHTTMNRPDLVKKLGRAVVEKHVVYQHQPYIFSQSLLRRSETNVPGRYVGF